MTNSTPTGMSGTPGMGTTTGVTGGRGTTGTDVREDAAAVAREAGGAGRRVADVTKDETKAVASETRRQARRLADEAGRELRDQAAVQQTRVASGLRSVGSQFSSMADGSTDGGVATDLVREAGQRVDRVAQWLDERDPGSLLQEVKTFARRRPGVFLAIAVGTGVIVGRLARALATPDEESDQGTARGRITPRTTMGDVTPVTTPVTGTAGTVGGAGTIGTTGTIGATGTVGTSADAGATGSAGWTDAEGESPRERSGL